MTYPRRTIDVVRVGERDPRCCPWRVGPAAALFRGFPTMLLQSMLNGGLLALDVYLAVLLWQGRRKS